MKTERNILIAFILNLLFSVFEFAGGIITGSIAILSDAIHDIGDAASIGISYFLERKSKKQPDETYTYDYARYSILGGLITTLILLFGSIVMIYSAVTRLFVPTEIHYNGMILFAVVGLCVNLCAAFFTREGGSLNQKAVNLHMLEDVLGWGVVLVGSVVMRLTNCSALDPILSIGVSLFILIHAVKNLREIFHLILEKAPRNLEVAAIRDHIREIHGVCDVHHIHLWSLDGSNNFATLHIVTDEDPYKMKAAVQEELRRHGIGHITIEIESSTEHCHEKHCHIEGFGHSGHCHHHHH